MAVRGFYAKDNVDSKIKSAFGSDYVGKYDGKIYVMADDGGEKIQVCLSMTCPKVAPQSSNSGMIDFDNPETVPQPVIQRSPTEITQEELDNVQILMKKLNLI